MIGLDELFVVWHTHSADDLRDISQVEGIMSLQWCGLQILLDLEEDLPGGSDDVFLHIGHIRIVLTDPEMPFEDTSENGSHSVFIEIGESNDVEVSLESWGDIRFTTSWRSHSSDDTCVNDISERMLVVFSVVPASLIDKLSQNFNWWLSSEYLLWHIEIINKDDAFHTESGTKVILSSLIKLHVNNVLDLVTSSLSGETDFDN